MSYKADPHKRKEWRAASVPRSFVRFFFCSCERLAGPIWIFLSHSRASSANFCSPPPRRRPTSGPYGRGSLFSRKITFLVWVTIPSDVCTLTFFCSQVARLQGRAGAAASSTAYEKPKVQKRTRITGLCLVY